MLEDARGGAGLEIDPDLIVLQMQEPHVRLEVSLAVEQRRVAALLSLERLGVVGELALQVLGGVRPADDQSCALPRQIAGLLPQGAVLPVELNRRRDLGHGPIVGRGARRLIASQS